MSDRVYVRVTMDGQTAKRELIADQMKIADVTYQDVATSVIEVTKILRHGKGEVVMNIGPRTVEMSFVDALDYVMQATSSLRW